MAELSLLGHRLHRANFQPFELYSKFTALSTLRDFCSFFEARGSVCGEPATWGVWRDSSMLVPHEPDVGGILEPFPAGLGVGNNARDSQEPCQFNMSCSA